MSKKPDVEKPNKQNVDRLLRELANDFASCRRESGYTKYHELNSQLSDLKEKLHDVSEVKKLEKQIEQERKLSDEWTKEVRNKIAKVRRAYYAKGLTPAVLKQLETLVDELNNDKT